MRDWTRRAPPRPAPKDRRQADLQLLRDLLAEQALADNLRSIFSDMLEDLEGLPQNRSHIYLSEPQRAWAERELAKFRGHEAENLVSRGLVPRGREVKTAAVLDPTKLPKTPPGRKR